MNRPKLDFTPEYADIFTIVKNRLNIRLRNKTGSMLWTVSAALCIRRRNTDNGLLNTYSFRIADPSIIRLRKYRMGFWGAVFAVRLFICQRTEERRNKMIIYHNDCTEPYENMATEEYLLDSCRRRRYFMLWRNEPAVIIGRNQTRTRKSIRKQPRGKILKLSGDSTGGGAVFHDLGNLNYTFISSDIENVTLNFARFCDPIIVALREPRT